MDSTVYVVIVSDHGIVDGASVFRSMDKAFEFGDNEWERLTGSDELNYELDPDGLTHNDEVDVWVFAESLGSK